MSLEWEHDAVKMTKKCWFESTKRAKKGESSGINTPLCRSRGKLRTRSRSDDEGAQGAYGGR